MQSFTLISQIKGAGVLMAGTENRYYKVLLVFTEKKYHI